ncbi:MAG: phosphate transport system regulatory protein PhoU [Candidatus Zixiibacteriota bacterium]|nr:MAG: phosphate transport system regulatory protein PhoU [candidate division Zixibacteria bacterium]
MTVHLQREVEKLKKKLLAISAMVQDIIDQAVEALRLRDARLAERVIESDEDIDRMELEIEEDCLKILALYNPVAHDLRFVVAVLKMNNDLERMADQAVNIAERAKYLSGCEDVDVPADLSRLADVVQQMLHNVLDALIHLDTHLARQVIRDDDQADEIHRRMYRLTQECIRRDPSQIEAQFNIISISRNLERIADQITNIAEDIIYMAEGHLVRHVHE